MLQILVYLMVEVCYVVCDVLTIMNACLAVLSLVSPFLLMTRGEKKRNYDFYDIFLLVVFL